MTLIQRATSVPLEWTSRSAPSSWMARPSNCRFGTRRVRRGFAPSPRATTEERTASS
ncbi:hypothetical protein JZ751_026947 [Albula glossodonta]|uniref:Uncharacterized protein n=1 Tax=Albula glossodonta TaxID=121402 RepID=A0A8T2NP91_9TELE|nr:hypothetical protein JZ751_026947 [Albula glossodonta]